MRRSSTSSPVPIGHTLAPHPGSTPAAPGVQIPTSALTKHLAPAAQKALQIQHLSECLW